MEVYYKTRIILSIIVILLFVVFVTVTPTGIRMWNRTLWMMGIDNGAGDTPSSTPSLSVEDTAREMLASYLSDRAIYDMHSGKQTEEHQALANEAMDKANATAAAYNEHMVKNKLVWKEPIPDYFPTELEIIVR